MDNSNESEGTIPPSEANSIKEKIRLAEIRAKFMSVSEPDSENFKQMEAKQVELLKEIKAESASADDAPLMNQSLVEIADVRLYNSVMAANTERIIRRNIRNVKMPETDDELVNEVIQYDLKGVINLDGENKKVAKGSITTLSILFIAWLLVLVMSFSALSFIFVKFSAGEIEYPLLALIPGMTALLAAVFSSLSIYRISKRKQIVRNACLNNMEDSLQMLRDLKIEYLIEAHSNTPDEAPL